MKKRICYIINPKSGTKGKERVPRLIEEHTDKNLVDAEICHTEAPGHGTELSRKAKENGFDVIVSVGGDGSMNEVAKGLINNNSEQHGTTALGIIPTGSGNGMARHLNIPLSLPEAIQTINTGKVATIDTLKVNDELCVGTFGIGFDGHIAHLFSQAGTRGYGTYVKLVLTEFYKYKPKTFDLEIVSSNSPTTHLSKECFLLTFANSTQFGNNAIIAPFANVQDGKLDISIMKKFPLWLAPHLIYRLMKNTIQKSRYFEALQVEEVRVKNNSTLHGHIDGEPVTFNTDLVIKVAPRSLNVIIP